MREKLNLKNIYILYTIFFGETVILIFSSFFLRGNGLVSNADGYNQVFPLFVYIREYIEDLMRGNVGQFDFRLGLGDDVFFSLSYYGLFDPISIISIFLFKAENIELAYYFSIFLKLYLSGIAFIWYAKKYVKVKEFLLVGSMLYVFNIYTLFWGIYFTPSLVATISCPLILCGIDEIVEEKKISLIMIAALLLQGLNGFYYLYMVIIIAIIYFIVIVICRFWKNEKDVLKQIWEKGIIVLINGILGVLLSSIVLIPSIIGFFNSTRQNGSESEIELFCGWEYFINSFGDLFIPNVYNSITTLSVLTVAGAIACIFTNKVKKEFKYLGIGCWLLVWCPFIGSIMNGFSYSTDRWFFAVVLFLTMITISTLQEVECLSKKTIVCYIILFGISIFIHWSNCDRKLGDVIRVGIFMAMGISLPLLWNGYRNKNKKILIYTCILVIGMGIFTYGPKILGGNGYSANFKQYGVYNTIKNSTEGHERRTSFERWDFINSSLGATLVADYYGTSEYFSILNANTVNFYQEMEISPGIRDAWHILKGIDGRKELMAMLSVSKYILTRGEDDLQQDTIKQNEIVLPLGYMYDTYILKNEFEELDPMKKNSQILNAIVLEEEKSEFKKAEMQKGKDSQLEFEIINCGKDKKRVYLEINNYIKSLESEKGEIYVQISNLHGDADVYVGNKNLVLKDSSYLYYTGIDEFWINVSEIEQDIKGYYFDIVIDGKTDFEQAELNVYWHPIDYKAIKERQENVLEKIDIETNLITGEIECERDGLLFFSIPYSTGWTIYVDGIEKDIEKANIAFMAIELEKGNHKIELVYQTPGLKCGSCISIISLIIIISLKLKELNEQKRRNAE